MLYLSCSPNNSTFPSLPHFKIEYFRSPYDAVAVAVASSHLQEYYLSVYHSCEPLYSRVPPVILKVSVVVIEGLVRLKLNSVT